MNPRLAIKILLSLSALLMAFHLSIVFKIIPYEITWGGRLKNDAEMYAFESFSLLINLLLFIALLIKGKHLKAFIPIKVVNGVLWFFLFLFGLNTIGNVFAKTNLEKSFTLLTLTFTALIWIILKRANK